MVEVLQPYFNVQMFSHFVHRELWCSASVLVDDYYSITFSFFFHS